MSERNVLITSSSKKVPLILETKVALRKVDANSLVFAGDSNANAITQHYADRFWQMPVSDAASIDDLLRGCIERKIVTVIPTRDGELLFWAEHSDVFHQRGINVIVPQTSSVELCLDKLRFGNIPEAGALQIVPTSLDLDDLRSDLFVVKERYGAGSQSIGIKLGRDAALAHGRSLSAPIYQPFIDGQEISVDAWISCSGEMKGLVLRRREIVISGESQVTTTFRDEKIELLASQVIDALRLRGPVVLQALIDRVGVMHIIECNSRIGGASTAAIAVGLDLLYWTILESQGADLALYPFVRRVDEVRQIRAPMDMHVYRSHF